MVAKNYTPLAVGAAANAATFNNVFQQLDDAILKNNFNATASPTANDDAGDGYSPGSRWLDVSHGTYWVCLDATIGAADWLPLGQSLVFNVRDFGAVGNGTTDDTAAIQAAINAAASGGGGSSAGGTVYFPPGDYKITSTLTLKANGLMLVGAGQRASILRVGFAGPGVSGDGTRRYGITIAHLAINGDGVTTQYLLKLQDIDMSLVYDVILSEATTYGLWVVGTAGATRNLILDSHILDCGTAVYLGAYSNSTRLWAMELEGNPVGVNIQGGNNQVLHGVMIEGVFASGNATGVIINVPTTTITGCRFELTASSGTATGVNLQSGAQTAYIAGNHYSLSGSTVYKVYVTSGVQATILDPLEWQVWVPTITGFSTPPSGGLYYFRVLGKLCHVSITMPNAGTSNATTFTITLPFTAVARSGGAWSGWGVGQDNGVVLTTPCRGSVTQNSNVLNLYSNAAVGAWTASGNKYITQFSLVYEIA